MIELNAIDEYAIYNDGSAKIKANVDPSVHNFEHFKNNATQFDLMKSFMNNESIRARLYMNEKCILLYGYISELYSYKEDELCKVDIALERVCLLEEVCCCARDTKTSASI
jgi:hypothetical protein